MVPCSPFHHPAGTAEGEGSPAVSQIWYAAPRCSERSSEIPFPTGTLSLLGPKPKSRKHMLGQRARAKAHPSNLEEAGGSSQSAANSHVFERLAAWARQRHNQSLNIPALAAAHCSAHTRHSLRSAMSGDTTVAKRFETLTFPVFIV